jgi:ABC-type hemin transport system ATPase subunit
MNAHMAIEHLLHDLPTAAMLANAVQLMRNGVADFRG